MVRSLLLVLGAGCLLAAELPLGHPDFMPSAERPVGFRGDGTGVFPGATMPKGWDDSSGQGILWKTPMPSWGYSSPIVVGKKVFVCTQPDLLVCVDADSGKLLWTTQADHLALFPKSEAQAAHQAWDQELADYHEFLTLLWEHNFLIGGRIGDIPGVDGGKKVEVPGAEARIAAIKARFAERGWGFIDMRVFDPMHKMYEVSRGQKSPQWQTVGPRRCELYNKYGFCFEQWRGWVGEAYRTPCSDGELVYAHFGYGQVMACDLDGTIKWINFFPPCNPSSTTRGEYKYVMECSTCPSPLLLGDRLILFGNGANDRSGKNRVRALDKRTGKLLWETAIGNINRDVGSPLAMWVGDLDLIVLAQGRILRASDGAILAEDLIQEKGTRIPNCAVAGDQVFFNWCVNHDGPPDAYVDAFRIVAAGKGIEASKLWRAATPCAFYLGPVLRGDRLYVEGREGKTLSGFIIDRSSGSVTRQDAANRFKEGGAPSSIVGDRIIRYNGEDGRFMTADLQGNYMNGTEYRIVMDARRDANSLPETKDLAGYLKRYATTRDMLPLHFAFAGGGGFFQGKRMYLHSTEYLYCIGSR